MGVPKCLIISELKDIAKYLTTATQAKKHGSYLIYEDSKIKIVYDTYHPNVDAYVKDGDELKLVLIHTGGGWDQEYHKGLWEEYVLNLHKQVEPAKSIAKEQAAIEKERKDKEDFAPIDDSHIFASK